MTRRLLLWLLWPCFVVGVLAGRERTALTASLERHRYELTTLREQLGQATAFIDEFERGGIVINDAQGAVQRAIGIGNELDALGGSTGGAIECIRSVLGLGDGGRSATGGVPSAGAGE